MAKDTQRKPPNHEATQRMQSAREQQQGHEETTRAGDQEFPDACSSCASPCELTSHAEEACVCSAEDDKADAPSSSVRPSRLSPQESAQLAVCPKLLQAYLPLVHQVVAQLARRLPANVLRDDLVAAGVVGLLDSLRRNGGDAGVAFEWYARTRIRGAVMDELRAQDWLTRRARAAVAKATREDATESRAAALVSLHELSPVEESDHLVAPGADPATTFEARDDYRVLALAMEQLPERERFIVGKHYFDGMKFKDIGAELKVSEPRVSQLHARALGRLRVIFHENAAQGRTPHKTRALLGAMLPPRRTSTPASASPARVA